MPSIEAVRAVLRRGPSTIASFRKAFNLKPLKARQYMGELAERGIVVVEGNKAGRRIRLADAAAPTKEEP